MLWLVIAISAYVTVTLGFLAAIQFERLKLEQDFNLFQIIVPVFWPAWFLLYLYTLAAEKLRK